MDSLRLIEIHNICKSVRAFTYVRMMDNTVLFGIVLLTNDCTVIVQEKNINQFNLVANLPRFEIWF